MRGTTPGIAVSITSGCNLRCDYCPKGGDDVGGFGWGKGISIGKELPGVDDFRRILLIAQQLGFSKFRFTGGEPMTNPQFPRYTNLIKELLENDQDARVILNTNGTILDRFIDELSGVTEHSSSSIFDGDLQRPQFIVAISLDTLDSRKFKGITQVDALDNVLDNIKLCASRDIPTRVNMVVTQKNVSEVQSVIDFCRGTGISLKLEDLNWSPSYLRGDENFWADNYFQLSRLGGSLERQFGSGKLIRPHGGYGIPETVFNMDKKRNTITIKNCSEGTTFCSGVCSKCMLSGQTHSNGLFKCQEGMYQVFLSTSQSASLCRYGPPETARFNLWGQDDGEVRETFEKIVDIFKESKLVKPRLHERVVPPDSIENLDSTTQKNANNQRGRSHPEREKR